MRKQYESTRGTFLKISSQQIELKPTQEPVKFFQKPNYDRAIYNKKSLRIKAIYGARKHREVMHLQESLTPINNEDIQFCLNSRAIYGDPITPSKEKLKITLEKSSEIFRFPQTTHQFSQSSSHKTSKIISQGISNIMRKQPHGPGFRTVASAPKLNEKLMKKKKAPKILWVKLAEIKRRQYSNLTAVDKQNALNSLPKMLNEHINNYMKTRNNMPSEILMFHTVESEQKNSLSKREKISLTTAKQPSRIQTMNKSESAASLGQKYGHMGGKIKKREVHFRVPCLALESQNMDSLCNKNLISIDSNLI